MYYNGCGLPQDYGKALKWFLEAAEKGNETAKLNVGTMYYTGDGMKQDFLEAKKWFLKTIEHEPKNGARPFITDQEEIDEVLHRDKMPGYREAQFNLGQIYCNGYGLPIDLTEGLKWYRRAAGNGSADAEYKMGNFYFNGKGVKKDYAQAIHWYKKSAFHGFASAQKTLATLYKQGKIIPKDLNEVAKWFERAAWQGMKKRKSCWTS
jgi:TPR repeat protein